MRGLKFLLRQEVYTKEDQQYKAASVTASCAKEKLGNSDACYYSKSARHSTYYASSPGPCFANPSIESSFDQLFLL